MDTSVVVSITLLGAFIAYPISALLAGLILPSRSTIVSIFRRYILNPQIRRSVPLGNLRGKYRTLNVLGRDVITLPYIFAMMIVLIANVVALAVNIDGRGLIKSREMLIARSGRVLVFNLGIICACGRQSLLSDSFGISLEFQGFFHRWLGRITFVDAIVHVVAALVRGGNTLSLESRIAAFTAAGAFLGLVIFSLPPIRRIAYEIFCNIHVALAFVLVVAIFLHQEPIGLSTPSAILTIITASVYVVILSLRLGVLLFQKADAIIYQGDGLLKVELKLRRPLRVSAGQQIWLRIPSAGYSGFTESHPFIISSWEKLDDGKAKTIMLLIEPREGFTRKLKILATSESLVPHQFAASIEGPYGRPTKAENYGTVILYATGIGIAAQLAVVRQLLEARESGRAKTQRITLLWEVEEELVYQDDKGNLKYDTASQMVVDLLNQDYVRLKDSMNPDWLDLKVQLEPQEGLAFSTVWKGADPDQGYVFRCTKYVKNHGSSSQSRQDHGHSASLSTVQGGLDPTQTLRMELGKENVKGDIFVSVCAYPEMADSIRKLVAHSGLHLHEHAFRPQMAGPKY